MPNPMRSEQRRTICNQACVLVLASVIGAPAFAAPEVTLGYIKPEVDTLRKVYGLRHAVRVAEPEMLDFTPEEWTSPLISADGGLVFVGTTDGTLRAMWIASGKVLWERKGFGDLGRAMAQHRDTLIVGADASVHGVEGFTGETLWSLDVRGSVGGQLAVTGTVAIVPVRSNAYVAVDVVAGKELWRVKRPTPDGITVRGHAAATVDRRAGRVYLGFSDGFLAAVRLGDGEQIWAVPLGNERALFADVDTKPIIGDGGRSVLAASYNGGLAKVNAETGRVIWKKADVLHLTGLEEVPDAQLVAASFGDGEILGIEPSGGTVRWRYKLADDSTPARPIALGEGLVLGGSTGGAAAVLEIASGRPIQMIAGGAGIHAEPSVRGSELAILTDKGMVLLFRRGEGSGVVH